DPDGRVLIRGALWRARTNRATPVHAGERIRVVAIDGLVLEVEPEEGGAIDYREMRNRRKGGDGDEVEEADTEDVTADTVDATPGDAAEDVETPPVTGDGAPENPPAEPNTR
ncbi:MAG: NfeD family protein, partial [Microthrixaceae bacterium]